MIYKFSFYVGELYIAELINEHMDLQEGRLTVGCLIRLSVVSSDCRLSHPTVSAVSRQSVLSPDSQCCLPTVSAVSRQSVLSPDSQCCLPTVGAVSRAVRCPLSVLFLQQC
jgi:hypothetical protein